MKKIFKKILLTIAISPLTAFEIKNPGNLFVSYGDNSIGHVTLVFVNILLGIVGVLSVLFIIIGGFQYITSRGDEEQATAGKNTLTNAIIGLIISVLAYIMVTVVLNAVLYNKI